MLRDGYEGLLFYDSLFDHYSTDGGSSSSMLMNDNAGRSCKSSQKRLARSNHHYHHYHHHHRPFNLQHNSMKHVKISSPIGLKVSSSMAHMTNQLAHTITMHTDSDDRNDFHPNNNQHRLHHPHSANSSSGSRSNSSLVQSMRRMIFKSKVRDQQSNVWALIDIDTTDGDDDDDDMMATSNNAFATTTTTTTTTAASTYGDDRRFMHTYINHHIDHDDALRQALHQHQHPIDDITPPPVVAVVMASNPFLSPNKASSGILPYSTSTTTSNHHHQQNHHQQNHHHHNGEKRHPPNMHSTEPGKYLSLKQSYLSFRTNKAILSNVISSLNLGTARDDDVEVKVRVLL